MSDRRPSTEAWSPSIRRSSRSSVRSTFASRPSKRPFPNQPSNVPTTPIASVLTTMFSAFIHASPGEEPTFDVSVAAATDATASPRVRSGLAFVGADLAGGALGAVDADDRGGLPTGLRRGADRLPPRRPWLRRPTPGPGPARGPGTSRAGQRELL